MLIWLVSTDEDLNGSRLPGLCWVRGKVGLGLPGPALIRQARMDAVTRLQSLGTGRVSSRTTYSLSLSTMFLS